MLEAAERVVFLIEEQFRASNLSVEEMRELLLRGDPLKEFGEAGRIELDDLDSDR